MNTTDMKISKRRSSRSNLLKTLQLGTVLLTAAAAAPSFAVLLDHGPGDALLTWPQWYRDTNGLALGLCKSQAPSPNGAAGTMCFPPAPDPAGFAGNLGPEMFYSMVGFKNINTGSDFKYRYIAGLESSYLPLGVPVHGTEVVFARVRVGLNFNTASKEGTYTVTHPYGVETFNNVKATQTSNVFGAGTAIFFTSDVPLGPVLNFEGALGGAVGPYIQWNNVLPSESLNVGGVNFLGDPNVPHSFTGSPFVSNGSGCSGEPLAAAGQPTNYICIQGPLGSNLDGLGHDYLFEYLGTVLGQVWGAPIAQALNIDGAYKSRSPLPGTNSIDVWATSSPNQRVILTGTGMPSVQMLPDGVVAGKYHAHVEFPSAQAVPAQVSVTNVTSNPITTKTAVLSDGVEISVASFNTNTGIINIAAHSSDQIVNPELVVQGIPGVPSAVVSSLMTVGQCAAISGFVPEQPNDVCFSYQLPANIEPPQSISVASAELDSHSDHLVTIVGNPDNLLSPPVANDLVGVNGFTNIPTSGTTNLTALGLPTDAVIITQPVNGSIVGGIFTPIAGALAGPDSFQYVRQSANNAPVSNVANADLTLIFQAQAPTANLDQFAARTTVAQTLNVLANDKAASTNPNDAIDPATVTIVSPPASGAYVVNANGTISYTPNSGGNVSFTYTVKNKAGQVSNTATVQMTNFTGPESVSVGKATYTIGTGKWVVVGGTNWFGPLLTQTVATCWTGTALAPTASTLIGTALVDTTGKFQVAPVGNTPVGVNGQLVTCQTTSGGKGAGTISAK